jgi:hypothetical protein
MADIDDDDDPKPPHGPRIYGHIAAAELTCPRCGTFHRFGNSGARARVTAQNPYDYKTGVFRCGVGSCKYRAYLGIVCWPIKPTRHSLTRPPDHVPTPGEAAQMRILGSFASGGRLGARREQKTHLECICGTPCPVHTAPPEPIGLKDATPRRAPVTPSDTDE